MIRALSPSYGRKGFSLVELLTVVAIILAMLSMIIPAGSSIRAKAHTAQCASNLRSMGVALMSYSMENGGRFPCSRDWIATFEDSRRWYNSKGPSILQNGKLWPYVNDEQAYLCPTFEQAFRRNPTYGDHTAVFTYSMNEYFSLPDLSDHMNVSFWHGQVNMIEGRIEKPSSLGIFSEESGWITPYNRWTMNNSALLVGRYGVRNAHIDAVASYHNPEDGDMLYGYGNVTFADGHVKLVHNSDSKEVFTPQRIKDGRGEKP